LELDILGFKINPVGEGGALDNSDVAVVDEHLCDFICSEIFLELELEDEFGKQLIILSLILGKFESLSRLQFC